MEALAELMANQREDLSKQIRAEVRSVAGSERKKKKKKSKKKSSSSKSSSTSSSDSSSTTSGASTKSHKKKERHGSEPTRKEILHMRPQELLDLDVDHVLPVSDAWLAWSSAPGDPEEQASRGRRLAREIQESHLREGTPRFMGGAYYERDFLTKLVRLALSPEPAEKRIKYMTSVVAARCEYVKAARLGGTKALLPWTFSARQAPSVVFTRRRTVCSSVRERRPQNRSRTSAS